MIVSNILTNQLKKYQYFFSDTLTLRKKILCPFHEENTPSFGLFWRGSKLKWHCFGCGEGGDLIDFLMKIKGLSFKEALNFLNIEDSKPTKLQTKKRDLIENFRTCCEKLYWINVDLFRILGILKLKAKTNKDIELLSTYYHKETIWLLELEILENGSDREKFELFREVCVC